MTTSDNHSLSADCGESPTFMHRVGAELKVIVREMTKSKEFANLIMMAAKGVPVLGQSLEAAKEVTQGLINLENSERQRRLQNYILGLLSDEQYNEKVEFRDQDVIPVVRKLAADDEAAKTEYYTRLTLALGRTPPGEMQDDLRFHFIRLVSSLTCYQIEFARELKIRQTVPVCGTVSFEAAELALTGQESGMVMQAVRSLQNAGLMKEKAYPPRGGKPEYTLYETTSDFNTLMDLLFHSSDFEPETVGLQPKEKSDIIMVGAPSFIDHLYDKYLPEELKKAGVTAKLVADNDKYMTTDWAPLYLHTGREGDGYNESIKVLITQEAVKPVGKHSPFKFNRQQYIKEKSSNKSEAEYFRKEMDRLVKIIVLTLDKNKQST